ncbi:hypothetical protein SAMN04487830_13223 [Pseudobutyrivibrio sp. OR37]|uniref:hypothetical protein n=1 Tax=Pseudobutyrivibrio sp. OR37 TaxID=1798186 RepID=UPI0008E5B52D|nr:hypothetical protein [Pseudobutyrivibrio sp. OR37]SFI23120.1 hypothetical protein SAMN04487830_13223 [Pseudobutyrivibrio sp. OR37]
MIRDPFEEYYRQLEPSKREKGNAWNTAIGLQAVDGLYPIFGRFMFLKKETRERLQCFLLNI